MAYRKALPWDHCYFYYTYTHKTYNTIFFRGLSMYMLPLQLKECNNLLGFKVHLRQYFKENIVMC
jgi:hypothetical protein